MDEVGGLATFEQEAAGACVERAEDVFVELECRQHQHAGRGERRVGCDAPCCFQSVHLGHADVHHDDGGIQRAHLFERLRAGGGLADDANVVARASPAGLPVGLGRVVELAPVFGVVTEHDDCAGLVRQLVQAPQ